MRARGYLLALAAMTAVQVLILIGVYGSRLTALDVPLTYSWTDPPAVSELWRPDPTLAESNGPVLQALTSTQVDTQLALSGATALFHGTWDEVDARLGAPVGSDQLDFPAPLERADIAVGRVLGLLVGSPAQLANAFLLGTYFVVLWTGAAFLWLWRRGSRWLVPFSALAVANAPYHFVRENFFAANYVLVLPTVVCCILLARPRPLGTAGRVGVVTWIAVAPFFGLYSAITAVVVASWTTIGLLLLGRQRSLGRSRRAVVATGWLWIWVGVWLVGDLLPTMSHWATSGPVESLQRTTAVSDKYALRLLDLFTQPETLMSFVGLRRSTWLSSAEFKGEGVVVGGLVGLAALGLAVWWLAVRLLRQPRHTGDRRSPWTRWMSGVDARTLIWLLIGTIALCSYGGLGSLANSTGLSVIKSWERVGFVSYPIMLLLVVSVAASWWRQARTPPTSASMTTGAVLLAVGAVLGVAAGVPVSADGHGAAAAESRWADVTSFYRRVESSAGLGPVLFLPTNTYPEGAVRCDLPQYDALIGYAVTTETRWGSGANRRRELAERQFAVTYALASAPDTAVALARRLGYNALVVDVRGLPVAERRSTTSRLEALSRESFTSEEGTLHYFDVRGSAAAVQAGAPTRLKDYELKRLYPECRVLPPTYGAGE